MLAPSARAHTVPRTATSSRRLASEVEASPPPEMTPVSRTPADTGALGGDNKDTRDASELRIMCKAGRRRVTSVSRSSRPPVRRLCVRAGSVKAARNEGGDGTRATTTQEAPEVEQEEFGDGNGGRHGVRARGNRCEGWPTRHRHPQAQLGGVGTPQEVAARAATPHSTGGSKSTAGTFGNFKNQLSTGGAQTTAGALESGKFSKLSTQTSQTTAGTLGGGELLGGEVRQVSMHHKVQSYMDMRMEGWSPRALLEREMVSEVDSSGEEKCAPVESFGRILE